MGIDGFATAHRLFSRHALQSHMRIFICLHILMFLIFLCNDGVLVSQPRAYVGNADTRWLATRADRKVRLLLRSHFAHCDFITTFFMSAKLHQGWRIFAVQDNE